MRITNRMLTSQYRKNLSEQQNRMSYYENQVSTKRKFFRGSEDPVGAIKAYRLRRDYMQAEQYETNLKEVESSLTMAESNLKGIQKNLESIYTSYLKGVDGTKEPEDKAIIATELRNLQDAIVGTLNAQVSEKYIFGGSSRDKAPFEMKTVGGERKLFYKGLDVADPANDEKFKKLSEEKSLIDLGLGLSFDGNDVNPESAFDVALPGIKFMGYGVNKEGVPNNLFTLIGKMADCFEKEQFNYDDFKPFQDNFMEQKKKTLQNITEIGTKTNYMDFLKTRNEDDKFNINEKLLNVEYRDPIDAITDFKMEEYAYKASLQMGNKILQPSFIDFMR